MTSRLFFTAASRRAFLSACAGAPFALRASSVDKTLFLTTPNGGLQPQAVVDQDGVIHLVYLGGDPAAAGVFYTRRPPGSPGFSAPIRINEISSSAIALGTVRGAHIALGRAGRVHVAWNGSSKAAPKGPLGSAPMFYTRMNDAGTAFEAPRNLMQISSGLDGGGALAADQFGNVYVTWHGQGAHRDHPMESESEQSRRVWMSRSTDSGRTFIEEVCVSPAGTGACGCCGMGALADSEGSLYLLYRSARETKHRDMYLLVSRDHGATFSATDLHPWEISACPMSTVCLAPSAHGVFAAWETHGQVYFALVDSHTLTPGTPVPAPGEGTGRKHPALAISANGQILFVWTEGTGWKKGGTLAGQLFDTTGNPIGAALKPAVVPVWSLATVIPDHSNRFVIVC